MFFEEYELKEWAKKGVRVLKQNADLPIDNHKKLPNNAYIITIDWEGNIWHDIVQSSAKVNIFDMYYDKFGKDTIKRLVQSEGRVNPKLYDNAPPKK